LDDVHFMDEMSWQVVQKLFEDGHRLLILCASRPLDTNTLRMSESFWSNLKGTYHEKGRFFNMELPPMAEEDMRHMIAKQLGHDEKMISNKLQKDIYNHSRGLPHFASELVEMFKRKDLIIKTEDNMLTWKQQPTTHLAGLDDLMIHRIDGLNSNVQTALRLGAVLGSAFDLLEVVSVDELLAEVKFEDRYQHAEKIHKALDLAIEEGILEEVVDGGEEEEAQESENEESLRESSSGKSSKHPYHKQNRTYNFTNDTWRSIILKLMLDARKKDMHRNIAQALERQGIEGSHDFRHMFKLFSHWKASEEYVKAASTSLKIGENFKSLGLQSQRIRVYLDALDMWRDADSNDIVAGGFGRSTLESIDHISLEYVIKLEIATGQTLADVHQGKESVEAYQNTLKIIQTAPASANLKDRSIVFPIFSGLFVALKFGQIQQDKDCSYEQELVKRFVHETRLHGDPIHYTRALAMQCEVYGRLRRFDKALESQKRIQKVYNVKKHSAAICKAYGSDRSAQSFSMSALWHLMMGHTKTALETCRYVIKELLPQMDEKNCHNSAIMMYPCIWVMKDNGYSIQARDAFERFVSSKFTQHFPEGASTFCLPLYKPLHILLTLSGTKTKELKENEFSEFLEWALVRENLQFSKTIDNSMSNFGRNAKAITAEICLQLGRRMRPSKKRAQLIEIGLELARESIQLTRGKDAAPGLIIAYRQIKPVYDGLQLIYADQFDFVS